MIRRLLAAALILLPAAAAAQELMYALPGGASSDNISTPNGFAAPGGVRFIALSAHTEPTANEDLDAVIVVGAGTGTAASAVEVAVITADVDRLSDQFLSVKWHFHNETARAPAVAVGVEDITSSASTRPTAYVAATKTFWDTSAHSAFFMRKAVSAGFGGGRFRNRFFGAVSASLDFFSKAIVEYDGNGLNTGVSIARPFSPRSVAVIVLGRQRIDNPTLRAWTVSLALAWEDR